MISVLIYSSKEEEQKSMKGISRELAAYLSEDNWTFYDFQNIKAVEVFIKKQVMLDVICFDITLDNSIAVIEQIRETNQNAFIILIADMMLSPIKYMKPSIMAASLLLRPLKMDQVKAELRELFQTFLRRRGSETIDDVFLLESREQKIRIPYEQISYFEAREKKIFVFVNQKEIAFYDTLDKLAEILPSYFVRCHRGYILNTKKIEKIIYSVNSIQLENNISIPFSRSYKNIVKEYEYGHKTI